MNTQRADQDLIISVPSQISYPYGSLTGTTFHRSKLPGPSSFHRENIIPTGQELEKVLSNISYAQSGQSTLNIEIDRQHETIDILAQRQDDVLHIEIARLRGIIDELVQRRDDLQLFEMQEKSLFSPIRKLPAELLCHIFHLTHGEYPGIWIPADYRSKADFVRRATQVSYYWRTIAHSCASLWSRILVNIEHATRSRPSKAALAGPLIQKCILHSKELPLFISFQDTGDCTPEFIGEGCIKMIGQNADRLKSFSIDNPSLLKAIDLYLAEDSFVNLQELRISSLTGPFHLKPTPKLASVYLSSPQHPYSIEFSFAPSLTHADLFYVDHPVTNIIKFPWSQITSLCLQVGKLAPNELYRMLQSMESSLKSLSMKGVVVDTTTKPITLPQLETLKLNGYYNTTYSLGIITAPNLKTLRLIDRVSSFSHVVEFLQRSRCALEEFELGMFEIDDSWDISELRSVKRFIWKDPQYAIDGIHRLTLTNGNGVRDNIFPQLESLFIETSNITNITQSRFAASENISVANAVTDMIKSRMEGHLKSATVQFRTVLKPKDTVILTAFLGSDMIRQSNTQITILAYEKGWFYLKCL